jgi:hypothetical protein
MHQGHQREFEKKISKMKRKKNYGITKNRRERLLTLIVFGSTPRLNLPIDF